LADGYLKYNIKLYAITLSFKFGNRYRKDTTHAKTQSPLGIILRGK